ncbi:MAG: zinc ribbon domain-containing protein [Thermoplasmata archaeon]
MSTVIYCTKCGTSLADDARFCAKCGNPIAPAGASPTAAAPTSAPSSGPTLAPSGVQELKCPACGAPIKPSFGEMVITCDYCGGSVTLGGQGWKEIQKHTMLLLKVTDPAAALKVVHDALDQGFMHRHEFEESKVADSKLSYIPFWVLPVSASTTYTYQAVAASVGATVGTMAAAELLGGVLGGRGRTTVIPIMAGPVVNPTRSETISGQYEFPVIAVKSMASYQPKDYQFSLTERTLFDKKSVPEGTQVLNGDLGEDAGRSAANAFVQQLQSEAAHKKHSVVSKLDTKVEISEGELLHVPIWYFQLERKGAKTIVLVDGHAGRVIRTVG